MGLPRAIKTPGRTAQILAGRGIFEPALLAVLAVAATYLLCAYPYLPTEKIPGDLGDARFNLYVLEHTFRLIADWNVSYQSPGFYYPYPGVLLFSDTHAGSVPFYVLFRSLGFSEFSSFKLWIFVGYLLTFLAGYYALRRFQFAPLPAFVAAIVFAFSLPSLAQIGHAQLVYRPGIPLAFLGLWNFLRSGLLKHLCWVVGWVSFQFLCSVYLGVFLLLALAAFAACSVLVNRRLHPPSALLSRTIQDLRSSQASEGIRRWYPAAIALFAAACAVLLLLTHQHWAAVYDFSRPWSEVSDMLPRPQSYFLMSILPYWKGLYLALIKADVPAAHEHNMFVGVGAFSLFVVGSVAAAFHDVPSNAGRISKAALLTLAVLFLFLTKFGNYSLYYLISSLPGINSIRAVTRICLVMVFPAALVIAAGVDVLLRSRPQASSLTVLCLMLVTVAAEIVMVGKDSFRAGEANLRVSEIVDQARKKSAGIANPILFVREGSEAPYNAHLDAMLAAQELGWPTVNGYSGHAVPGYSYVSTCETPTRQIEAYQSWRKTHGIGPDLDRESFLARLVMVGWPDCRPGDVGDIDGLGPAPKPGLAKFISLKPVSLEQRQSQIAFEIVIRNNSDERLHVHSFRPVRASWRFVEVDAKSEEKGSWDTRMQLARDILPHSQTNVALTAELPKKPGNYRLQVSLVSELGFWFYDNGSEILQFEQTITVR